MKKIRLTQGQFALVDDEDYKYLTQWKWYAKHERSTYYAARTALVGIQMTTIRMHREIMKTPKRLQVDHIDHNGFNNQKYNLRNCTNAQNHLNRLSHGKSKYLGVTYGKQKYIVAHITVNNKTIHLGSFKSEEEAAKARDKASILYHGEYANLNFK